MGNLYSMIGSLFEKKQARILMVGLDAAGKTTILFKLKLNETQSTVPTIGFNVETVEYKNIKFHVWDVGGQDKLRTLWRHYYEDANAIIFVVDSNDQERLPIVKKELSKLLGEYCLENATLLLYCNKQDLPNAMPTRMVVEQLELSSMVGRRQWFAQGCSAVTGDGLYEGLDWLSGHLPSSSS
eukprot:PhM_4_TR18191/c0_g1_i1/m.30055/K07937/ARF1; ADP-ribosylation factor 1